MMCYFQEDSPAVVAQAERFVDRRKFSGKHNFNHRAPDGNDLPLLPH
jgi:hypothetical protein